MRIFLKLLRIFGLLALAGAAMGTMIAFGTVLYLSPKLPSTDELKAVQLQTPLRIYSKDRKLIAEFGEKRRKPLYYNQIPMDAIHAIIAAEDDRFFQHSGVDVAGLTRAFVELVQSGSIRSGGSTITMQVAKNFFLSHERKFIRKFNEILLALQIEQSLSKEEILELYLNKIFLGNRAYGIAAAAEVYYGKSVNELSLAQIAMIAGLPKAPSRYNPIVNPQRAKQRRDWILGRMLELGYVDKPEYQEAIEQPITAVYHGLNTELSAPYFAEMVRQEIYSKFGKDSYQNGYNVYTTLDSNLQQSAEHAVMTGLINYTERHGYRGAEQQLAEIKKPDDWLDQLESPQYIGPLKAAYVTASDEKSATLLLPKGESITLGLKAMEWARPYISENSMGPKPTKVSDVIKTGDIVRVRELPLEKDQKEPSWKLSQIPVVQGSLTSINAHNGAIVSMIGGFSFELSKFNRAMQARRQAGSCFKPFVYGAAIADNYTPASIINDAPIVYDDVSQGEAWRPRNSGDQFKGPIRLRQALYESRNLVSIRLLQSLGTQKVIDFAAEAGLDRSRIPANLSIALGTAQFTTAEMARAYSTIANGGYKIEPYFIDEITDGNGELVFKADPLIACGMDCDVGVAQATQVIDPRDQFLLNSMLQDVIKRGTGRKARSLERSDIAGKTGTTNDQRDAWFSGYHPQLATSVWVGFDQPESLGRREFGGVAALPIWIEYMGTALKSLPETHFPQPDGITSVKIDPETGLRALQGQPDVIFEYFKTENAPEEWDSTNPPPPPSMRSESETIESIF